MNIDVKTGLFGFVIGGASGLGLGQALLAKADFLGRLAQLGSFLGGIGTVLACFVAFFAYRRWQRQFDYPLALELIKRLELDNINVQKALIHYIKVQRDFDITPPKSDLEIARNNHAAAKCRNVLDSFVLATDQLSAVLADNDSWRKRGRKFRNDIYREMNSISLQSDEIKAFTIIGGMRNEISELRYNVRSYF